MRFQFNYGKNGCLIPDRNVIQVIEPVRCEVQPFDTLVKQSLCNPIEKPRLRAMMRKNKPGDIVIIVSDRTRAIANYAAILDLLIGELVDAGVDEKNIECLVALGTHRKHTEQENEHLYSKVLQSVKLSFHDCHKDVQSIGKTSTGLEVLINKRACEADFVIATGKINFHYMAGFSGGRKAVLPGIAGYETIRGNHCKLRRDCVDQGKLKGNIIAQEMDEAAAMFGLDYILNMVETPDNRTCGVFCGDPRRAFNEGVQFFKSKRFIPVPRVADCVFTSTGSRTDKQTFYVGHKVLNSVTQVIKPGGLIVLVAECGQGVGNDDFYKILSGMTIDDLLCAAEEVIQIGGHRAYQTARLLKDYNIMVVSDVEKQELSNMNFNTMPDFETALQQVIKRAGDDFTCYVVPDGLSVMPVVQKEE